MIYIVDSPRSSPSPPTVAAEQAADSDVDDDDDDDNFATFDWQQHNERDLIAYHAVMEPVPAHSSQFPRIQQARRRYASLCYSYLIYSWRVIRKLVEQGWRGCQGWLICALVGICTGAIASMVDMSVHWVIDARQGRCIDSFVLSNLVCCAAIQDS